MAKMGMLAAARGVASEARMPVREKSRGPWTFMAIQPVSLERLAGTEEVGETMDNSPVVQVIERKALSCQTQLGIRWSGDRRVMVRL